MKHLSLLFLLMISIAGINTQAGAQGQVPKQHQIFIDAKGGVYNHAGGTKLGYIDKDNIVRNNQGKKLYFIDRNGNVISADGKNLGKARKDGTYYNAQGENIITVKDKDAQTCEILDPQGHSMGIVHKNYKLHACAAHCFFLQQDKLKKSKPQQGQAKPKT